MLHFLISDYFKENNLNLFLMLWWLHIMLMVSCSNSDKYDRNFPVVEESPSVSLLIFLREVRFIYWIHLYILFIHSTNSSRAPHMCSVEVHRWIGEVLPYLNKSLFSNELNISIFPWKTSKLLCITGYKGQNKSDTYFFKI